MQPRCADQQRDLFEVDDPPVQLCDQHKQRLVRTGADDAARDSISEEVGDQEDQF
jgi:hypothetical protein